MPVPPIAMITDTDIAHHSLTLCPDNRDGEGKRPRGAVYPTAVAKRLLSEMVADLQENLVTPEVNAIVGNRRKVTTRKNGLQSL